MHLKNLLKYSGSNIIIQGLNLVLYFLVLKYLTLPEIGKYNVAKSFSLVFLFTHAGLRYSLDRRLPVGSDKLRLSQLKLVLNVTLLLSVIALLVIVVYEFDPVYLIFCIGGILISLVTVFRVYLRASGAVNEFIRLSYVSGIITIALPIAGLIINGLIGLTIGYLLSCVFLFTWYVARFYFGRSSFRFSWNYRKKFFLVGLPLYASNILLFVGDGLDKVLIYDRTTLDFVGEFSIITTIFSLLVVVPSMINEIYLPDYVKQKNNAAGLSKVFWGHIKLSSIVLVTMMAGVLLIVPMLFDLLFPKYFYLMPFLKTVAAGIAPYILLNSVLAVLFTFNKSVYILISNAIAIGFYVILIYVLPISSLTFERLLFIKFAVPYILLLFLLIFFFATGMNKKLR